MTTLLAAVELNPLVVMAIGMATVIGMIIVGKINAFISLITAAIVVSLLSPGDASEKISRVAAAFGSTAGSIGIVIAMAAVIGKCMMDSGSADRIVQAMLRLFGAKRAPTALMSSGYVLAIPVFFDTVFYLLVPLARSLYRRTGGHYLKYVLAISAGGVATHGLVPPTPGPLLMADLLTIDLGTMILVGAMVALPASFAGLYFGAWLDRKMNLPMRELPGETAPAHSDEPAKLPGLFWSLMPIVLPIALITANTALTARADGEHAARFSAVEAIDYAALRNAMRADAARDAQSPAGRLLERLPQPAAAAVRSDQPLADADRSALIDGLNRVLAQRDFYDAKAFGTVVLTGEANKMLSKDRTRLSLAQVERLNRLLLESAYPDVIAPHIWRTDARKWAEISDIFGNASLTLMLSGAIAMFVLWRQRRPSRQQMAHVVEVSLMSGGIIILITAAGGAFGAMLKTARVGDEIEAMFGGAGATGMTMLLLGFTVAVVMKIAQGSGTVSMITTSGMLAAMLVTPESREALGYHPVYLATAIGSGSSVGSWMNDSGFWIYAKMGGFTELESLKTWTPTLVVVGAVGMVTTVILANVMPLT